MVAPVEVAIIAAITGGLVSALGRWLKGLVRGRNTIEVRLKSGNTIKIGGTQVNRAAIIEALPKIDAAGAAEGHAQE